VRFNIPRTRQSSSLYSVGSRVCQWWPELYTRILSAKDLEQALNGREKGEEKGSYPWTLLRKNKSSPLIQKSDQFVWLEKAITIS
jgi:hypothetical protein